MKFFTPSAYRRFHSAAAFTRASDRYLAHIESLRGRLPDRILDLAKPMGTEDGLVSQVKHDRAKKELTLILRCGHLQMGYYNLELRYIGAEISKEHDLALAQIARSGRDLRYHEIDIGPNGTLEHRLLFRLRWSRAPDEGILWISIRCQDLKWRARPVKSRRLAPLKDRYPAAPPTS